MALGLAVGGIHGVVGYLASARRHEIGVRMALGARRADVLWLVLTDGLGPVAAGAGSLGGTSPARAAVRAIARKMRYNTVACYFGSCRGICR